MDERREKYINLFTDYGFKRVFGSEMNKDLLIDFLNELLKGKEKKIVDLTYLASEQISRTEIDRKAIYDLYCENEAGERFIVELQKAKQKFFKDRSIYYSTFPIQHQALKGEWNYELKAVYTVGILDFIFDEDEKSNNDIKENHIENVEDGIVTIAKIINEKTGKVFYNKLTYVYLEIPKFKKKLENITTHFEKWLFVFKYLHRLQKRPLELQETVFNKLFETAEISKFTNEEYTAYETSLKAHRDYKNTIDFAKEEGFELGIEQGIEQGKMQEKINIAKSLLDVLDDETIAVKTGFSEEEVKQLRNETL